jgi:D-glycero-alpha-D-manno-heptose-7-phosphate kinase
MKRVLKSAQQKHGIVISQTPFRISLFGGGTDLKDYFNRHGGSVVGMTINKYVYVVINSLERLSEERIRLSYSQLEQVNSPEELRHEIANEILTRHAGFINGGFIDLHTFADLPASSGVGSSSSFTVGMLNALYFLHEKRRTPEQLSKEAIDIERDKLNHMGGWQDQILAAYGGLNRIDFSKNSFCVQPIILSDEKANALEKSCLLFFTGDSRSSSEIHHKINESNHHSSSNRSLEEMKEYADEAFHILKGEASSKIMIGDLGHLINRAWESKKKLSPHISNDKIDRIHKTGIAAGAYGGKICGAGSGGFFLFIVPEHKQDSVKNALKEYKHLKISIEYRGSRIIYQKIFDH